MRPGWLRGRRVHDADGARQPNHDIDGGVGPAGPLGKAPYLLVERSPRVLVATNGTGVVAPFTYFCELPITRNSRTPLLAAIDRTATSEDHSA